MKHIELVVIICLLFVAAYFINQRLNDTKLEQFNDTVGRFCYDCSGKNFNQCLNCANCGYCIDRYGNSSCVPGDHNGPYNCDDCGFWYHGDDWSYALQRNKYCI